MPPHASMARLRRAGREDSVLDGVSALSPLPLQERARVRGSVTSLPGECCPTPQWHGFAAQDTRTPSSTGFRRRCAAWRVTFLCVAKEKSPKERPPPLVRPPASGFLGSPVCPTARADGPSLAQRRSLGVLPRGLDKRAHLGEQQGATHNPRHRGRLTGVGSNKRSALHLDNHTQPVRSTDRAGCYLTATPSPTPWRDQIVAPMQQISSIWLHR